VATASREMELHRRYDSPHVAPLVDFAVAAAPAGRPAVAEVLALFPVYPGGTLQARCDALHAAHQFLPEAELLRLFAGVCRGVRALHAGSPPLAHRDLKPGNVMLAADGTPVLIDLGSADAAVVPLPTRHAVAAVQERAAQHSSMPYRAPELFDASRVDAITAAADIWVWAFAWAWGPYCR
jgi:serine/threonine kinase 16